MRLCPSDLWHSSDDQQILICYLVATGPCVAILEKLAMAVPLNVNIISFTS